MAHFIPPHIVVPPRKVKLPKDQSTPPPHGKKIEAIPEEPGPPLKDRPVEREWPVPHPGGETIIEPPPARPIPDAPIPDSIGTSEFPLSFSPGI